MYTGDNAEYWPEFDIFTTPRMSHFEFFAEYYNLNPPVFVCPGAPLRTSKNKEELKSFYWESFTDAPKLDAFYKAESDITKRLCSYGTSEWILMKHATTEDKGGAQQAAQEFQLCQSQRRRNCWRLASLQRRRMETLFAEIHL